jgi:hypothetical protein
VIIVEAATLIPDPGGSGGSGASASTTSWCFDVEISGRGSCPILVTRWRTFSTSAWGVGPGLKCLPDAMTLNQERKLILKNLGKIVDPPIAYDDDGVLNPEGGIGPGDWIPRMPGSKVEQLKQEGNIEAAYYEQGRPGRHSPRPSTSTARASAARRRRPSASGRTRRTRRAAGSNCRPARSTTRACWPCCCASST